MKELQVLIDDIDHVKYNEVDVKQSSLKSNEVRIEPVYYGICGSDLHVLAGKHPVARPPVVPGHEIAAIVTEVGSDVTDIKVGDHVTVDPIMACMECPACKAGRFNLCEPPHVAGFRAPGLARSSSVIPARNCHKAPKDLPLKVLAFAEPATCAYHCVHRLPKHCLDEVLVIGAGTIGLGIVQGLRILGCGNIVVIEPDENKRKLAKKLGAHEVFDVNQLPKERSFSGVIDVVASQNTITDACTRVKAGGAVVCMGVPSGPREIPLPMMNRFERDLLNSGMYIPSDFDGAIEWLSKGLFDTSDLITEIYPIEETEKAYKRAKDPDSIKILIQFREED